VKNPCVESGKATGLFRLPTRRIRCIVCGRLVKLRVSWPLGTIYIPPHNLPAEWQRPKRKVLKGHVDS